MQSQFTGIGQNSGLQQNSARGGFKLDANGRPVDVKGNPVKFDANGNPVDAQGNPLRFDS